MLTSSKVAATLIGAGNLATSLAVSIAEAGFEVVQVASRTASAAAALADRVGASHTTSLSSIDTTATLYIVAVPDCEIANALSSLPPLKGMVVHTSGTTPMDVFNGNKFPNHGVLYPFQTFSKTRDVAMLNVPICIEANSPANLAFIDDFAQHLSQRVTAMQSEQRRWLHLMGVFSSNFVNYMLTIAHRIATEKGIDFSTIQPLVEETINKALVGNPALVQTGPAIRNDTETINKHLEMLKSIDPQLQRIYNELSLGIKSGIDR